jgi:hypothetical protein
MAQRADLTTTRTPQFVIVKRTRPVARARLTLPTTTDAKTRTPLARVRL